MALKIEPRVVYRLSDIDDTVFTKAQAFANANPNNIVSAVNTTSNVNKVYAADNSPYVIKETMDAEIAAAKLNIQRWLPAVNTVALLPAPSSIADRTVAYLCRVIADPTTTNNGVWQLIQNDTAWAYYSDNLDFVDETELTAALATRVDKSQGVANSGKMLGIGTDGNVAPTTNQGILFTYVVDSDAKLADWKANVAGNDYSAVLIAPGSYTVSNNSSLINLTDTKTKVVVGAPGSKINVGMRYTTAPSGTDVYLYRIEDVTVEQPNIILTAPTTYNVFNNCVNLKNCYVNATLTGSSSSITVAAAFINCINLYGCSATISAPRTIFAFYQCQHLMLCTCSLTTSAGNACGINGCVDLVQCSSTCVSNDTSSEAHGFDGCRRLTSCYAEAISTNTNSGNAYGFLNCNNVSNCIGSGQIPVPVTGTGRGYSFSGCYSMMLNHADAYTNSGYYNCYASASSATTNLVGDNANGGFNKG